MSEVNIAIPAGQSRRLLTGGKYCPDNIVVRAEKPVPIEEKDVNFWDYDGKLLYSYTLEEALALTELPPGPQCHEGLVFAGWNWPLEAINALTYQVDVGALYDTDDHATHLHIELTRAMTIPVVANGTGYIDWGDGSLRTELVSAPNSTVSSHAYHNPGKYIIRVGSDTSDITLGYSDGSRNCLGSQAAVLRKAFFGSSCKAHTAVCYSCTWLKHTTCGPEGVAPSKAYVNAYNLCCLHVSSGLGESVLLNCYSLRLFTSYKGMYMSNCMNGCHALPRIRSVRDNELSGTNQFQGDYNLKEASGTIHSHNERAFSGSETLTKFDMSPESTGIGAYAFNACYILYELDIRENVTDIGAYALYYCMGLRRLRFRPTVPPVVANANAFTAIPGECVVEVPAASLEEYKNATNYSTLAKRMVGV